MEAIIGLLGLSPLSLLAVAAAVLAALGALWKTKHDSKVAGRAEERAKTDAANNALIRDKKTIDQDVARLREEEARRELNRWGGNP